MPRNILVTGATGKQGGALTRALLNPSTPDSEAESLYHVYALTRSVSSPSAQHLSEAYPSNLTVVEGNLEDKESIAKIFEDAKADGGIWGVFAVCAFPGLGAEADGEERQGKNIADLALSYGVQTFVYSSALRSGPKYEDTLELSQKAKRNIEQHCVDLGGKGLNWTILQPGFFLENFDGFTGSIGVAALKLGLKKETNIAFIASEDIGHVAAGVFAQPERYKHKILAVVGEYCTMSQLDEEHQRATGRPVPAVPWAFAWLLLKMNSGIQGLVSHLELNYHARVSGEYPSAVAEVNLANTTYRMKTCYELFEQEKKEVPTSGNCNQVSIVKLLTGR